MPSQNYHLYPNPGIFKKITSLPQITLFASLIPDMYFHACARSKIQITAPPDQLSFFAATNEKGRSHFPYIWISQIFSQIIFSLFAPPINSMTTLYHKGERINANFTGAPSHTSSNLSDGLLIFSAPLGEQQEARGLGRHLGAGAAGGQGDEGHPGQDHPDNHGDHCVKRAPLLYFIRS